MHALGGSGWLGRVDLVESPAPPQPDHAATICIRTDLQRRRFASRPMRWSPPPPPRVAQVPLELALRPTYGVETRDVFYPDWFVGKWKVSSALKQVLPACNVSGTGAVRG